MADFTIIKDTNANIENIPIVDGQLLLSNEGYIYIDTYDENEILKRISLNKRYVGDVTDLYLSNANNQYSLKANIQSINELLYRTKYLTKTLSFNVGEIPTFIFDLESLPYTDDKEIDVYLNVYGINPTSIEVDEYENSVTVTFPQFTTDLYGTNSLTCEIHYKQP